MTVPQHTASVPGARTPPLTSHLPSTVVPLPLNVRFALTLGELEAEVVAWDDLAARAAPKRPMFAASWVLPALARLERGGSRFCVGLAHRGTRLIGVLPLVEVRRWPARCYAAPNDMQTFSGGPIVEPTEDPAPVYGAWFSAPPLRRAAALVLPGAIRDAAWLETQIAATADTFAATIRSARTRGACLRTDVAYDVPWGHMSSKSRQRVKTARRRLEEAGPLVHRVGIGADALARVPEFLALERSSWKGEGGSPIADDPAVFAFYTDWCQRFAARGLLQVNELVCGERTIAAELCVRFAGVLYMQKIAYAGDLARESPGHVLWADTVRWACEQPDIEAIDTIGTDDIRERWGAVIYDYANVHLIRRTAWARLVAGLPLQLRVRAARWRHGSA